MAKGGGAEVGATKRGKGMSHRRMKRLSRRRSCVGGFAAIGAVWRDQLDPVSSQFIVERVAVVGAITDQIFWLGFNHVEVEAQLHQANFMMIGGVRAYRKQSMTIDNRHDCRLSVGWPAACRQPRNQRRPSQVRGGNEHRGIGGRA